MENAESLPFSVLDKPELPKMFLPRVGIRFAGLPGTGKSALARAVAEYIPGAYRLDVDDLRVGLFGYTHTLDSDQELNEMEASYHQLHLQVARVLQANGTYLVAATYSRPMGRNIIRKITKALGGSILEVGLVLDDEDEIKRRLARRNQEGDNSNIRDWEDYQKLKQRFEPFEERTLILDAARPIAELRDQTLQALLEFRQPNWKIIHQLFMK